MQVTVTGRHMHVTDPIRTYAEEKIGRIAKVFDAEPMNADLVIRVEKNPANPTPAVAEITLHMKRAVVRAEEAASDMYAAIDMAVDKAERQMRKYKKRIIDKRNHGQMVVKTAPGDSQLSEPVEEEREVVRTKTVDAKPMSEEEAMLQLELLGHDFYVFKHEDSNLLNVIYRRNDGDYGLIQPRA
jgi:putative sigma-54 modulation protein